MLRQYNNADFQIKQVFCDREFKTIMDEIKDELDTDMNYTGTDKHVPEAEHNNQTIEERVRVRYHHLSFKTMLRVMLKYLAITTIEYFLSKKKNIRILQFTCIT